jgi:hypothetical protein
VSAAARFVAPTTAIIASTTAAAAIITTAAAAIIPAAAAIVASAARVAAAATIITTAATAIIAATAAAAAAGTTIVATPATSAIIAPAAAAIIATTTTIATSAAAAVIRRRPDQHEVGDHDLRRGAHLAVVTLPFAQIEAAGDLDRISLADVFVDHINQALIERDCSKPHGGLIATALDVHRNRKRGHFASVGFPGLRICPDITGDFDVCARWH